VYVWIWRRLPGGIPGKLTGSLVLLAGVLALLFFYGFPWLEKHVPFNDVTVDQHVTSTPSPSPSGTPTP
jgi:hypothetical protein